MNKNHYLLGGLFWIAVSVFFVFNAIGYGLFRKGVPGPGFLPFIVGIILFLSGLLDIIMTNRQPIVGSTSDKKLLEMGSVRRTCFALLSLVVSVVTIQYLGFLVTAFLTMILLLKKIHPLRWSFESWAG